MDLNCQFNNLVINKDLKSMDIKIEQSKNSNIIPNDKRLCNPIKVNRKLIDRLITRFGKS